MHSVNAYTMFENFLCMCEPSQENGLLGNCNDSKTHKWRMVPAQVTNFKRTSTSHLLSVSPLSQEYIWLSTPLGGESSVHAQKEPIYSTEEEDCRYPATITEGVGPLQANDGSWRRTKSDISFIQCWRNSLIIYSKGPLSQQVKIWTLPITVH